MTTHHAGDLPPPGLSRRLAALLALAAPILVLAAGLHATVHHLGNVVVVVVAVAVLTVATWYTLTRRGLLRIGALAVALVALAAVILVGLLLFVLQAALLVVFGLASRYALGPDTARLANSFLRDVEPARAGVLLINPRSGGGAAARADLAAAATARGIRTVTLAPGDDLARLAEQAASDGADVLGMAGGDGSQAVVAAAAVRHGIAYVCVPAGTRNHFALDLGLDRRQVRQALDAFTDGVERTVDLGRVNDRVFVNNASLGVYAEVVRSRAYRRAKIRTWGRLLPDLLGPDAARPDLSFDGPDGQRHAGMPLVLVSNNPYQLARFGWGRDRPRLDTGRLGILAARIPRAQIADVLDWVSPDFQVCSAGPVPVAIDGEALVETPPLRFSCLPGVLRVRLPRQIRVARPAALTRHDLAALARIASGRPAVPASPAATGSPAAPPPT